MCRPSIAGWCRRGWLLVFFIIGFAAVANATITSSVAIWPKVTIYAESRPVDQILLEVAEKYGYQITINGDLGNKISCRLEDVPLDAIISRLLRGYNYSLELLSREKIIRINLVNSSIAPGNKRDVYVSDTAVTKMSGSDRAMEQYRQMQARGELKQSRQTGNVSVSKKGSMSGSDRAMEQYRQMRANGELKQSHQTGDMPVSKKGPMAGSDRAMEQYKVMHSHYSHH